MRKNDPSPSLPAEGSERDVVDQRQPELSEQDIERMPDISEASEADVIDQARVARPSGHYDEPSIRPDVPEADALDQARSVLLDEDDEA